MSLYSILNSSASSRSKLLEHDADARPGKEHRSYDGGAPRGLNGSAGEGDCEVSEDDPTSQEALTYPEGGLTAWLVVFGSWCAMVAW